MPLATVVFIDGLGNRLVTVDLTFTTFTILHHSLPTVTTKSVVYVPPSLLRHALYPLTRRVAIAVVIKNLL